MQLNATEIEEGDSLTLTGEFAGRLRIEWGDGEIETHEAVEGPFSFSHPYADDPDGPDDRFFIAVYDDSTPALPVLLQTAAVRVRNAAPQVEIGENQRALDLAKSSDLSFIAQVSDRGADPHQWTWRVTQNGADVTNQVNPSYPATLAEPFVFAPAAAGTYVVTLTVDDGDSGISSDTSTVFVAAPPVNQPLPPTADAGGPYTVGEGGSIVLDGSASRSNPPGGSLTYAWDFNGDNVIDQEGPTPEFSAAGIDGPAELTVALLVTDQNGLTDTATVSLTVTNAAPVLGAVAVPQAIQGKEVELSLTFTDAGLQDTHTATIDWGDGTTDDSQAEVTQTAGGGTVAADHIFAAAGTYQVQVTVTDDDGDSATTTHTVVVNQRLQIESIKVNDGTDPQRSNIETLSIKFNRPTNLQELIGDGRILNAVKLFRVAASNSQVPLTANRFQYHISTQTLTIDLTTDGFNGSKKTLLTDARYELWLDESLICAAGSPENNLWDNMADTIQRIAFHRLEGDFDGSAAVNSNDNDELFAHYGGRIDNPATNYTYAYDLNADGRVNATDYSLLIRKYGKSV
jgi:hypothetical protein